MTEQPEQITEQDLTTMEADVEEAREATRPKATTEPSMGNRGLQLTGFDDMWRLANAIVRGGFGPKGMDANGVLVAIQFGAEVGLGPMQAVQNISVVNGHPALWGDAPLALCMRSPHFSHNDFTETYEGEPFNDDFCSCVTVRRIGQHEPLLSRYSVADAKRAKLWGKQGPWTTDPKRMLKYRARAFALRDRFPDVLKGLSIGEEVSDIDAAIGRVDLEKTGDQLRAEMSKSLDDAIPEPKPEPKPAKKSKPDPVTGSEAITLRMTIENHLKRLSPEETKIAFSKVGIADATRLQFMDVDALNGLLELVRPAQ